MQTKKQLLAAFSTANKTLIFRVLLCSLSTVVATLLIPVFVGKYYQLAFQTHSTRAKMFDVVFFDIQSIRVFFICFALLIALKFAFDFWTKYGLGLVNERLSKSVREQLFHAQMNADLTFHQRKETGLYLLRYSGDLTAIQNYLTKGIIMFANDCTHLVLAVVILSFYNNTLTGLLLLCFPIIFVAVFLLNKRLKIITGKKRDVRSKNLSFVASRLHAFLTIKAFNRQNIEQDKFLKNSDKQYDFGRQYAFWYALIYALLPFMLYGILVGVLGVAYYLKHHQNQAIDGHDLVTFIMTLVSSIPVFKRILGVHFIWQTGDVSFNKILPILNGKTTPTISQKQPLAPEGRIGMNDVAFSYAENMPVFEKLTFHIEPHSTVLINGGHQSGKSTLFKLLLGLYQCNTGYILIDGVYLHEFNEWELRRKMTIASDEFPLLGKTVFEAVSYSRKEDRRKPTFAMLKQLGFAHENDQESVLNMPIFEGGKNLSYSQRKLLNLARALLTNKKIILLDEPFDGIDANVADQVAQVLKGFQSDHTLLVIDRSVPKRLSFDATLQL
ncbi:MAG: hypothetical protein CFE24_11615 [Flavobacterium sp. BFFFF2]|nr:MAG: hypothetical protein CFE24_11615 [Flavobacterium sp. BFFFF2]